MRWYTFVKATCLLYCAVLFPRHRYLEKGKHHTCVCVCVCGFVGGKGGQVEDLFLLLACVLARLG